MKVLIVGGGPGKDSGVITKITRLFSELPETDLVVSCNGYNPGRDDVDTKGYDLILWWPDIDNAEEKIYPVKDQGAVLVCSKMMRALTTRTDAVSRIFKMHGNAVVAISLPPAKAGCESCIRNCKGTHPSCCQETGWHDYYYGGPFQFELIDALNNTWRKTTDLSKLVQMIVDLYKWTKESKRRSLKQNMAVDAALDKLPMEEIGEFMQLNRGLALKVAEGCGNRFFGNFSTRCTKLFPSTRKGKDYFFFSPRNVDKRYLEPSDVVLCDHEYYYGDRKPSVDTPVQLELYKHFPNINWMIHGHAYIKDAFMTDFYCPCGDMREVDEVVKLVSATGSARVNLLNHGFILMSKTLKGMYKHFEECDFKMIGG